MDDGFKSLRSKEDFIELIDKDLRYYLLYDFSFVLYNKYNAYNKYYKILLNWIIFSIK